MNVKLGEYRTYPKMLRRRIYKIENGRVFIITGEGTSTDAVEFSLGAVKEFIKNGHYRMVGDGILKRVI